MKSLAGLTAIFGISFLAELTHALLPALLIPAPIWGILYLFAALAVGIIKLDTLGGTARTLLSFFPVLLLPACAGIFDSFAHHPDLIVPFLIITPLATLVCLFCSGTAAQIGGRIDERRNKHS